MAVNLAGKRSQCWAVVREVRKDEAIKEEEVTFKLEDLIKLASSNSRGKDGKWYPARPIGDKFSLCSLKSAWLVFIGKADAVIWPEGQ